MRAKERERMREGGKEAGDRETEKEKGNILNELMNGVEIELPVKNI